MKCTRPRNGISNPQYKDPQKARLLQRLRHLLLDAPDHRIQIPALAIGQDEEGRRDACVGALLPLGVAVVDSSLHGEAYLGSTVVGAHGIYMRGGRGDGFGGVGAGDGPEGGVLRAEGKDVEEGVAGGEGFEHDLRDYEDRLLVSEVSEKTNKKRSIHLERGAYSVHLPAGHGAAAVDEENELLLRQRREIEARDECEGVSVCLLLRTLLNRVALHHAPWVVQARALDDKHHVLIKPFGAAELDVRFTGIVLAFELDMRRAEVSTNRVRGGHDVPDRGGHLEGDG